MKNKYCPTVKDKQIEFLKRKLEEALYEVKRQETQLYGKKWKEGMPVPACVNDCSWFAGNKLNYKHWQNEVVELRKINSNANKIIGDISQENSDIVKTLQAEIKAIKKK